MPAILDPEHYLNAITLFFRLLGLVYFFIFISLHFQIKGLIGKGGILPVEDFLWAVWRYFGKKSYFRYPTLFWFSSSDRMLQGVTLTGVIASLCLLFHLLPVPLLLFLLYVLHLSIFWAGQDFLSFGWETFLLEITCNAFLLSLTPNPNLLVWLSINLLLFRFHFQGGAVKLQSADPNWRNLTAIAYHYQTQPLPNAVAWYIYKLPKWFHKVCTTWMFFVELIVPFAIFGGEELRLFAFFCLVSLQVFIWATGNFSYLNHITIILCILLIPNSYIPFFLSPTLTVKGIDDLVSLAGFALLTLQLISLWNHFFPRRNLIKFLSWIYPYLIINRYGIFAIMTTQRVEIVVEGSEDGVEWKEYLFRYKPSEVIRRPRRISPFQPRLDWQAWFLPFSQFESEPWFQNFLLHLLKNTPEVVSLLRYNPFPEKPPRYVRALMYDYQFSDEKTKKETGAWWTRQLVGTYSPDISLKEKISS